MNRMVRIGVLALVSLAPQLVSAQTVTFHLHQEKNANGSNLRLQEPDAPATAIVTSDLKNTTFAYPTISNFTADIGSPNTGAIAVGSTFSVALWMKKSTAFGTVFPFVQIRSGLGSGNICE